MKKQNNIGRILLFVLVMILLLNLVSASSINQTEIRESIIKNDALVQQNGLEESYIDSEITKVFENQTWITIIVNLWDTTGISITADYSKEDFGILNGLKREFLRNRTNYILSELPESEFQLKNILATEDGFVGKVTKQGFEKLKTNSYISKISLSTTVYPTNSGLTEIIPTENNSNEYNPKDIIPETKPKINGGSNSYFKDWFQTTGSIVAFLTLILALFEFKKKRVKLKIELNQKEFKSYIKEDYESISITEIRINAELKNKGLEPTTINGVEFISDYKELNKINMSTSKNHWQAGISMSFEPLRLEANDRITWELIVFKNIILPPKIDKLGATLIFKTTHKDIKKKILLEREKVK